MSLRPKVQFLTVIGGEKSHDVSACARSAQNQWRGSTERGERGGTKWIGNPKAGTGRPTTI
jgi:hypothetical protein